jgi:hypothetical protein
MRCAIYVTMPAALLAIWLPVDNSTSLSISTRADNTAMSKPTPTEISASIKRSFVTVLIC